MLDAAGASGAVTDARVRTRACWGFSRLVSVNIIFGLGSIAIGADGVPASPGRLHIV